MYHATSENEQDLPIIFEKTQEISKRQYNKLIHHFKMKSPADKTLRLFEAYASTLKNEPIDKPAFFDVSVK